MASHGGRYLLSIDSCTKIPSVSWAVNLCFIGANTICWRPPPFSRLPSPSSAPSEEVDIEFPSSSVSHRRVVTDTTITTTTKTTANNTTAAAAAPPLRHPPITMKLWLLILLFAYALGAPYQQSLLAVLSIAPPLTPPSPSSSPVPSDEVDIGGIEIKE